MSGEKYFALDLYTGKIETPEGVPTDEVLEKSLLAQKDYSNYLFPEIFEAENEKFDKLHSLLFKEIGEKNVSGKIEFVEVNNTLLANYHYVNSKDKVTNKFFAVEKQKEKVIFNEVLNKSTEAYVPDSFFVHKNLLFLLKEKKEVMEFELK